MFALWVPCTAQMGRTRLIIALIERTHTRERNLSGGRKWPAVVKSYLASVSALGCHVTRVHVCPRIEKDQLQHIVYGDVRLRERADEHVSTHAHLACVCVCGIINACQRFDANASIVIA